MSFACSNVDLQYIAEGGVGIVCGDAIECFKSDSELLKDYEALPLWGYGVRNPGEYHVSTYITRDCENVDAAWKLLMTMSTEESALIQRYGEVDKAWNQTDGGLRLYYDTWLSTGTDNWRTIEATIYTDIRQELVPDLEIYDRYILVDEMWKSYEAHPENRTRTFDPWGESELIKQRQKYILDFTTGKWDIEDDTHWAQYVAEIQGLQ